MKIGFYAGSWPQNIGNAFFDLGAEATLKAAFPDAEFYRTGGAVHWMFNNSAKTQKNRYIRKLTDTFTRVKPNGNSIEIAEIAELDLLVFAGMSVCSEFAFNNGKSLLAASKNGTAILGLGVGASKYTDEDVRPFSELFTRIGKYVLITRDDDSYRLINSFGMQGHKGIDSAFFLPDYYKAPHVRLGSFDVVTFDSGKCPKYVLESAVNPIFTHHDLWGPLPRKYITKPKSLVSDVPEDYLTLYANCRVTYSDRVHACIASLAYGNQARLYSDTPRKSLFEKLGLSNICNDKVSVDSEKLTSFKQLQIKLVKDEVERMVIR